MEYFYQLYISYRIPYRTPRGMSYRLQYRVPSETYSALCNLQWVHKGNIDIMGSWFSHITSPLNGLGFLKGITEFHIRKKTLIGSVSICCLILGPGFLHIEPLVSHINPSLNGLGNTKENLQKWAPHLLHIIQLILLMFHRIKKKHLQGTELPLLSSQLCIHFFTMHFFPLCMVFLTVKYLARKSHACSNYRLLYVPVLFLNR